MRITIDVVIANCTMTLDELNHLQNSQVKPLTNFSQSEVMLKSGNQIIAIGTLVLAGDQYCVSIDRVDQDAIG